MNGPLRPLLILAALLCSLAAATAGTIPATTKNYALTVKGDCYTISGGQFHYLRSYQKAGRMQVRPRLATATPTTNGANTRDIAIFVANGINGGTGSVQLVSNAALASLFSATFAQSLDVAFVSPNAAQTKLTFTVDPKLIGALGSNLFKLADGSTSEIYAVTAMTCNITFLANGRISGDYAIAGRGYLGRGQGYLTGRFTGVPATKFKP